MNKTFKKVLSVVLSLAMVMTSITVYNTTAKAVDAETVVDFTVTAQKDANNGITATWTHPAGMEKYEQEYYLGTPDSIVEDEAHWAKNGTNN
mgnify:CR=1 FL=1